MAVVYTGGEELLFPKLLHKKIVVFLPAEITSGWCSKYILWIKEASNGRSSICDGSVEQLYISEDAIIKQYYFPSIKQLTNVFFS
jgi:hypothetical protein